MTGRGPPASVRVTSRRRPPAWPVIRRRHGSRQRAWTTPTCWAVARPATTDSQRRDSRPITSRLRRSATTATRRAPGLRPSSTTPGSPPTAFRATTAPAPLARVRPTSRRRRRASRVTSSRPGTPASRVDHAQVLGSCFSCHDGTVGHAARTPLTSRPTMTARVCHTTVQWRPANFSHTGVTESCVGLP